MWTDGQGVPTSELSDLLHADGPRRAAAPRPAKQGIARNRSVYLASDRSQQPDLFVADILDASPRGDTASMEHPLFALKAGDRRARTYERNNHTVTVKPGSDGCATIHDKDLWIYCISQMVEARNRGRKISRVVRFKAYDFLRATNRDTSGRAYIRLAEMLQRLCGTRIETNIETAGRRERGFFGLIDSAKVIERGLDDRMVAVEVTLSDWLVRSVEAMQVLSLSREYFRLRKPLDRRIYELARKHCGKQSNWRVSLAVLHQKSGSASPVRNFREDVRGLVASGHLPDYLVAYDAGRDMVTFYTYGQKGRIAEARDIQAGRAHASIAAHEKAHARKGRRRSGRS